MERTIQDITSNTLTVILRERITRRGADEYLSAKTIEGMRMYKKHWPDEVQLLLQRSEDNQGGIQDVKLIKSELPFSYKVILFTDPDIKKNVSGSAMVLTTLDDFEQARIPIICDQLAIPCISIAELTLHTSFQIINSNTNNFLLRLRRYIWAWNWERQKRKTAAHCASVQFNGIPSYERYKGLIKDPLLFLDSRTREADYIGKEELKKRLEVLLEKKPIRLVYSGRLTEIKGVEHLIKIAKKLVKKGVNFELAIYGDGNLYHKLKRDIEKHRLTEHVILKGSVDFEGELIPVLKKEADIFVCCHRQGDPSCTYLETLACGLPIVCYSNEAFAGLMEHADVGWKINMDDCDAFVSKLIYLDKNRDDITVKSKNALEFATHHTFEKTFTKRIEHLKSFLP